MSLPVKVYLFAYNSLQALGWMISLFLILNGFYSAKSINGGYVSAGDLIGVVQSASFAEVLHGSLGIVPSGMLSPLMQWSGKTHFLLAVVRKIMEVQDSPWLSITLLAWSLGEIIRYPQYALSSLGRCPSWLTFLRYTVFIVLYPVGFIGEMLIMYEALPYIKSKNLYSNSFSSLPFSYHDFMRVLLVLYPFLWFKLYLHMLKQRRSKLGKQQDVKWFFSKQRKRQRTVTLNPTAKPKTKTKRRTLIFSRNRRRKRSTKSKKENREERKRVYFVMGIFDINLHHGGNFVMVDDILRFVGGTLTVLGLYETEGFNYWDTRKKLTVFGELNLLEFFSRDDNLGLGRKYILDEDDVKIMLSEAVRYGSINLYMADHIDDEVSGDKVVEGGPYVSTDEDAGDDESDNQEDVGHNARGCPAKDKDPVPKEATVRKPPGRPRKYPQSEPVTKKKKGKEPVTQGSQSVTGRNQELSHHNQLIYRLEKAWGYVIAGLQILLIFTVEAARWIWMTIL